jgi:hypothetical protein
MSKEIDYGASIRGGVLSAVQRDGSTLTLSIKGLKRWGLRWTSRLIFRDVAWIRSWDLRLQREDVHELHPGWRPEQLVFDGAVARLTAREPMGWPGDAVVATFTIACSEIQQKLRL